ncbi:hypothetical protein J1N35_022431 [Gossypium stocksii]|uniref:Uncharacterized protein n=1 Tax=Gossypium stocksii TaxID=47602 RepID=A0A9D3VG39_9ROSI|nr:hypothetical protein J1N35_022431 [Gossypium stocksii]
MMSVEEEYYINLHVEGKFVHDPHARYLGGEMDNLRVVWNDSTIINSINYWVKLKEINLYIEHEIDTVVFVDDESMLTVRCLQFGGDSNEGGEVVDSKCSEGEGEGGELMRVRKRMMRLLAVKVVRVWLRVVRLLKV